MYWYTQFVQIMELQTKQAANADIKDKQLALSKGIRTIDTARSYGLNAEEKTTC